MSYDFYVSRSSLTIYRQARDGQFLRFAVDGAASLKMYPEGPSGNCLLQTVPNGSGGIKLKTNHGTFLSLTRDSSVKAVATGRTGFRVQCEGGKYVFTHESGKFLGVAEGKVSGLNLRSANSEFDVVPGEPKALDAAAASKTPSKTPASKETLKSPLKIGAAAGGEPPAPQVVDADEKAHSIIEPAVAAVDIKSTIVPQALTFLSPPKTPESAAHEAPVAISSAPVAAARSRRKDEGKPEHAPNAELPLAFSL